MSVINELERSNPTVLLTWMLVGNLSGNNSDCSDNPSDQLNPIFALIFYSAVFILSFCGNLTVIVVMCFCSRTKSTTNMLITNLAVSDLLVCLTSLWLTPMYWYSGNFVYGEWTCYLFPFFQCCSVCNSSLSLLVLAMDRYFVVCRNEAGRQRKLNLTPKTCGLAIVLIWIVAICIALPIFLHMKIETKFRCGETVWKCKESWINKNAVKFYGIFVMLIQFALPLSFIGYSNIQIYLYLQRQCQSNFRLRVVSTRKSSLFRMLLAMVIAFATSWLPITILNVIRDLHYAHILHPHYNMLFMLSHGLAMSGTTLNPIIYCFCNQSFRDEFTRIASELKLLNKLCPPRRSKRSTNSAGIGNDQIVNRPLLDMHRQVTLMQKGNGVRIPKNESPIERSFTTTPLTASQSFPTNKNERYTSDT
ncbi:G-PROTEIN-RECEP-F1-2 domain-containing protein [Aphelenchoides besseyi]|nr:G-PROTEIN-RECEP-F1-2 domain-containing protein [Aphelenchoides besseyi]